MPGKSKDLKFTQKNSEPKCQPNVTSIGQSINGGPKDIRRCHKRDRSDHQILVTLRKVVHNLEIAKNGATVFGASLLQLQEHLGHIHAGREESSI